MSTGTMNNTPQQEYIYGSNMSLLFRSLQLDTEWIRLSHIPEKYRFIAKKYFFLLAPFLFWDAKASAYKLRVWNQDIFLKSREQIGNIQSIFINHAYLPQLVPQNAIVIDIGAHMGEFAILSDTILHAARIYSFEPVRESYNMLARNKIKDTYNSAIGNASEITMYVPRLTVMASIYPFYPDAHQEKVKCMTLDSVPEIQELPHVDLLKIDVEGMEFDVLEASKETIQKTRYILMEISVDRPATKPALDTLEYLHTIAPAFELVHMGQVFGNAQRTDSADLLFKNMNLA